MSEPDRERHRSDRGEWAVVAALSLAGLGVAVGSQPLVAAATLPLWYLVAAAFGTSGEAAVRLERRLVTGARTAAAPTAAPSPAIRATA